MLRDPSFDQPIPNLRGDNSPFRGTKPKLTSYSVSPHPKPTRHISWYGHLTEPASTSAGKNLIDLECCPYSECQLRNVLRIPTRNRGNIDYNPRRSHRTLSRRSEVRADQTEPAFELDIKLVPENPNSHPPPYNEGQWLVPLYLGICEYVL